MKYNPPPIIDSAKLLQFAANDDEVEYTGQINLHVGTVDNGLEKISEMPYLAITQTYGENDYLLMLCDSDWNAKGVIVYTTIEEAKIRAERAYKGISQKWQTSSYTQNEIDDFLRDEYEVDPKSEWWAMICSFCGKKDAELDQLLQGRHASICKSCVLEFYKEFTIKDE